MTTVVRVRLRGEWIREELGRRGWSQADWRRKLAMYEGCSRITANTVLDWLESYRWPNFPSLYAICHSLSTTIEQITVIGEEPRSRERIRDRSDI